MYTHTHTHTFIYIHTYIHIYTHTYNEYTHTQTHMCTHTHIHTLLTSPSFLLLFPLLPLTHLSLTTLYTVPCMLGDWNIAHSDMYGDDCTQW